MPKIDAEAAQDIADFFLANEIGNLLMVGKPQLTQNCGDYWQMSILLGSARRGLLGEVETLCVDANTGAVLFDPKEKVKRNAKSFLSVFQD